MKTIKISYVQRREVDNETYDHTTYRVITLITSVKIVDTETNVETDDDVIKHFFLMKRNTTTGTEYLKDSIFRTPGTLEFFRETGAEKIDDLYWSDLVNDTNTCITRNETELNLEATVAAQGTTHGYYVSNILVREFNTLEDANNHAENIQNILKAFKLRYDSVINSFSTMNDSTQYPSGWEYFEL